MAPRILIFVLVLCGVAGANDLVVIAPSGTSVSSASATAEQVQTTAQGAVSGDKITFTKLLPGTPYSVAMKLADGRTIQGVNLSWYDSEQVHKNPAPINADDLHEIQQIIDVPSFYDKSTILAYQGNHDRATMLVRLLRDSAFHSDTGGEVIWRIELWYFKNEYGGWAKVPQQNAVLRRERYPTRDAYEQATGHIVWAPALGGIKLDKQQATTTLTLQPEDLNPVLPTTTAPSATPDDLGKGEHEPQ